MERASGKLRNFIIEPFLPHKDDEEAYVCIYSHRYADTILFYHLGGVDIGDVDAKALRVDVPIDATISAAEIEAKLLKEVAPAKKKLVFYIIFSLLSKLLKYRRNICLLVRAASTNHWKTRQA